MAALDRQHPRDLFDIRDFLDNEGISDYLRRAFIVYLISHDRAMAEVLAPTRKSLEEEFERGFAGMTREAVPLEALVEAREAIIAMMVEEMPDDHRHFLVSFKRGTPNWGLLGLPSAAALPAVRWKQMNLALLPDAKRSELLARLEAVLFNVDH